MVFSRYVSVLRAARKTFGPQSFIRENLLEDPSFFRTSKNLRFFSAAECEISLDSQSANKSPLGSSAFHENVKNPPEPTHRSTANVYPAVRVPIGDVDTIAGARRPSDPESLDFFEDPRVPGALDPSDGDLSHVLPFAQASFNFAAWANDSQMIQELAKLGVDFHRLENRKGILEFMMKRDWKDLQSHIQFLHDCGVPADKLGNFITKNPRIFGEEIDDLKTRIRYLRAHKFDSDMVARIVSTNPHWLSFDTKRIDERLGYFQKHYQLDGPEVRYLATKQPRLITYGFRSLREIDFAFKEEMGFGKDQVKSILLKKPRLFMKNRPRLVTVFDYVHNTMKIPHEIMVAQPNILTCRIERLRQRYQFLVALGKVQFDPNLPGYISPDALIRGSDLEFCRDVANTTVVTYNMYLKTL